jgi:hypothetical protein
MRFILQSDVTKPRGETSTLKLPPEILLLILSQLGRNSQELIRASAVCGRWRVVAIYSPYLWTKIDVHLEGVNKRREKALLNLIDLFLSRTRDLLLDVEWHAYRKDESVPVFYNLFRQKGSFNRWKSLSLGLSKEVTHNMEELREIDKFSSLEFLMFVHTPPPSYLDLIGKTVTINLHTLELGGNINCSSNLVSGYDNLFGNITTIKVWSGVVLPKVLLPFNIHTLQAHTMPDVPIPHIRHLFVKNIGLEFLSRPHVANLVTLLIHISVDGPSTSFTITLPRLRWLGMKENSFSALAAFKLPALHTLSIENPDREAQTAEGPFLAALRNGFKVSKLLMLFLDLRLDGPATLEVLRFFPDLSRLDLHFHDSERGQAILSHVFPGRENFNICPSLDVLRVILDTPPPNETEWKQCVRDTARCIGDTFWTLESKWPNGKYSKLYGLGSRQKVPCIYPWRLA